MRKQTNWTRQPLSTKKHEHSLPHSQDLTHVLRSYNFAQNAVFIPL